MMYMKRGYFLCLLLLTSNAFGQTVVEFSYDHNNRLTHMGLRNDMVLEYTQEGDGNRTVASSAASVDSDGDLEPDFVDVDDDNDQLPDAWEIANGYDPLDASDVNLDSDNDGYSALLEYMLGTNPRANDSELVVSNDGEIPFLPFWAYGFLVLIGAHTIRKRRSSMQS